jgi:hypothetical protein
MTNRTHFLAGATYVLLAPVVVLAGCTTSAPPAAKQASAPAQPRMASYTCGEDGEITIENLGSVVRVYGPGDPAARAGEGDGTAAPAMPVELTAAPPGQQSRFGVNGYALVLEGREALWMKAGKAPLTCTR